MRALYLAQTGMSEPLAQSQVLPYLRGLVRRGWAFDVVAQEPAAVTHGQVAETVAALAADGIAYHPARRSASHGRVTKLVETSTLFTTALSIARRNRPQIVHGRSDLAGLAATAVAAVTPGARSIFDCRGFVADEYADFGHWRHGSLNYLGLRRLMIELLRRADAYVVLTEAARRHIIDAGWSDATHTSEVVPCCVDLAKFNVTDEDRKAARARLGLGDALVLAYVGNLGSWYCEPEMAQLFAAVRARVPNARLLVLTRADASKLRRALADAAVPEDAAVIRAAAHAEVPGLLACADAGISFARPAFSKVASSPVKIAEYLALGVPVVMNRGVGDEDACLDAGRGVIDAGDLSPAAISAAAAKIRPATAAIRSEARAVAEARFDLEAVGIARYAALYDRLR